MRRLAAVVLPLLLACACSNSELPTSPKTNLGGGTVTVFAFEAVSQAGVPGLQVEVRAADTGALVAQGVTGADGRLSLSVPAETVNIRLSPPSGYSYAPGAAVTVNSQLTIASGVNAGFTIPLTRT